MGKPKVKTQPRLGPVVTSANGQHANGAGPGHTDRVVTDSDGVSHVTISGGRVVKVVGVSPLITAEIRRSYPPPTPPIQVVIGLDEKPHEEPNTGHPDYLRQVEDYNLMVEDRSRDVMFELGIILDMDESREAELDRVLSVMRTAGINVPDHKSSKVLYVSYILIKNEDDYNLLANVIMGKSQASEEAIQSAERTF